MSGKNTKQEAHRTHGSSEKRYQSINTFAKSYDHIKREKYIISLLKIDWSLFVTSET